MWTCFMSTRNHPCVCGLTCETYPQMKHQREGCGIWKTRPDPVALMIHRRRKTRQARTDEAQIFERCPLCERRPDHHDSACPNSQAEVVRRESIEKHGIDPREWEFFLKL